MAILATALGKVLSEKRGLKRLQLPSQLGTRFATVVVAECNRMTGTSEAAVISLEPTAAENFISPERAAELRSRDDGSPAKALIVNFRNEYREWNTLEPFRLLNSALLPGGLIHGTDSELTIGEICDAILLDLVERPKGNFQFSAGEGSHVLVAVAKYLAHAYAELGSGEAAWDEAWWQHLDSMLEALLVVLADWHGQPIELEDFALAAYASAGLPKPANPVHGYKEQHGAGAYARIIREFWSSEPEATTSARDLALDWVPKKEGRAVDQYPLVQQLSGGDLTDARARFGHALSSLALLGAPGLERPRAWALVDEDPFFSRRRLEIDTELRGIAPNGADVELVRTGMTRPMTLLPVPNCQLDNGRLPLGTYDLIVAGDYSDHFDTIEVSCSPASLKAELKEKLRRGEGASSVRIELALQLPASLAVWREAPYRLDVTLRGGGLQPLTAAPLNLYVPCPGATSVIVFEDRKGKSDGRRFVPPPRECRMAAGAVIEVPPESGIRELQVPAAVTRVNLYSVGPAPEISAQARWQAVTSGVEGAQAALSVVIGAGIEIRSENDILAILHDEQALAPVSPILAAAKDTFASDDVSELDEFRAHADPRWLIEQWQAKVFIVPQVGEAPRDSLGQVHFAIDAHGAESDRLFHHPSGGFTLGQVDPSDALPEGFKDHPSIDAFWQAFGGIGLHDLCRGKAAENSAWPSKLDLRSVPREKVEDYLKAFVGLLELAAVGPQYKGFAYPFSCIAFSKVDGKVRGVLLSALHPLRLAWNWAAQQAARNATERLDSSDAVNLLRFIDGGELPCAGPALSLGQALVATPLSPGHGSLFSTWSFLSLPGGLAGEKAPQMGGSVFPAGAISGLNGDSWRSDPRLLASEPVRFESGHRPAHD